MTRRVAPAVVLLFCAGAALAQNQTPPSWFWSSKLELRANYRDSHEERFALRFPFPPDFLPVGQTVGYQETVNAGRHLELSVVDLHLDLGYQKYFRAHAKLRGIDRYKQNPTSTDRKFDADELYLVFGDRPEFPERPEHSSVFLQLGKAPKMERQPLRLLESYGLANTAFNRLEDVQALVGGTVGRNFYWRFQASSGNPLFFRDSNALAGDNGIPELLQKNPDPRLKSGLPILYNAKVDGYFINTDHLQLGEGLGYRWEREDRSAGYDVFVFHYRRSMADHAHLFGTFYSGDLDLLRGTGGISLSLSGNTKEETGGRLYSEWRGATVMAQFTKQLIAGLHRQGYEVEAGYQFPLHIGPQIGGTALINSIQPAVRLSGLENRFKGPRNFIAPSVWWNWTKIDYGIRIGFPHSTDLTVEYTRHNIVVPVKLDLSETLVTLRARI